MATTPATEFLKHVLGEDGQQAFEKANARVPTIGDALAPRTIISWLTTSVRVGYEGAIPGLDNSYISLQKHDGGFTGALTVGELVHSFEDADILHVASAIAISLGLENLQIDPRVKSTDISKLGKSIDMLVKARVVVRSVFDALKTAKTELPGKAAAPKKPQEVVPPDMPVPIAPQTNKTTKPPLSKAKELMVKKSEAERECAECGLTQFRRDRFVGCMCVKALAKNVSSVATTNGYLLKIPSSLSQEEFETLAEVLLGT